MNSATNTRASFPAACASAWRSSAHWPQGLDILLLDEAFSALDYQTRLNVTDDVYRILKREQVTTLMVTHDIPESISMGDKILGPFRAARAGKGDPVRGLRAGALAALGAGQPAVRPLLRPYMERAEYR